MLDCTVLIIIIYNYTHIFLSFYHVTSFRVEATSIVRIRILLTFKCYIFLILARK